MSIVLKFRTFGQLATVSVLVTAGFSFDDEPTVNSKDELTVATSGSHDLRRRSGADPAGAGSALRRLAASHLAQLDHQVKGVVNGSFTAKALPDIGVQSGSAGPAVRPCGFSSGAGSCRAASKIIRVLLDHAANQGI